MSRVAFAKVQADRTRRPAQSAILGSPSLLGCIQKYTMPSAGRMRKRALHCGATAAAARYLSAQDYRTAARRARSLHYCRRPARSCCSTTDHRARDQSWVRSYSHCTSEHRTLPTKQANRQPCLLHAHSEHLLFGACRGTCSCIRYAYWQPQSQVPVGNVT